MNENENPKSQVAEEVRAEVLKKYLKKNSKQSLCSFLSKLLCYYHRKPNQKNVKSMQKFLKVKTIVIYLILTSRRLMYSIFGKATWQLSYE